MRWRLCFMLLLLPSSIPTAEAFSCPEEESLGRGALHVWEPGEGIVATARVNRVTMGNDCGLGNPHALTADRLMWLERSGSAGVHELDLATGKLIKHTTGLELLGLGATPAGPLAAGRTADSSEDDPAMQAVLFTATGPQAVPPPPVDDWSGRLYGPVTVMHLRDHWEQPWSIAAYDLLRQEWLLEPADRGSLGLPDDAQLWTASSDWLVFYSRPPGMIVTGPTIDIGQVWALPLVGGPPVEVALNVLAARNAGLDGDELVVQVAMPDGPLFGVVAVNILNGEQRDFGQPPYAFKGAVAQGRIVVVQELSNEEVGFGMPTLPIGLAISTLAWAARRRGRG